MVMVSDCKQNSITLKNWGMFILDINEAQVTLSVLTVMKFVASTQLWMCRETFKVCDLNYTSSSIKFSSPLPSLLQSLSNCWSLSRSLLSAWSPSTSRDITCALHFSLVPFNTSTFFIWHGWGAPLWYSSQRQSYSEKKDCIWLFYKIIKVKKKSKKCCCRKYLHLAELTSLSANSCEPEVALSRIPLLPAAWKQIG